MSRFVLLLFVLLLSGCSCWPTGSFFSHGVSQYRGDGTIRDISSHSGFFSTYGYVLDLGKFDMGGSFDKQFRLENLPVVSDSKVRIYFAIEDGEHLQSHFGKYRKNTHVKIPGETDFVWWEVVRFKDSDAKVTIALSDATGSDMTGFSSKLSGLESDSPSRGYTGYWLEAEPGSSFAPRSRATYSLRVRYSGDAALRGLRGCIYLRSSCGGS